MGSDLYNNLIKYLEDHLAAIRQVIAFVIFHCRILSDTNKNI
jgi:hypothetical protein